MDELDLLARALPDAPPPSPEVVARARARLAAAPRPRRRPWMMWAPLATAAVVALVFSLVTSLAPIPEAAKPPKPNQELFDLADRIEKLPARSGLYWREVVIDGSYLPLSGYTVLATSRLETWQPRDAADPVLMWRWKPSARPATAADERAWRAAGAPGQFKGFCDRSEPCEPMPINDEQHGCVYWQGVDPKGSYGNRSVATFTMAELAALPADEARLKERLRAYHKAQEGRGFDSFEEFLPTAATLLSAPIGPAQRAAIIRILAALPTTKVVGTVTDPLGRKGLSVDLGTPGGSLVYSQRKELPVSYRWFLDPASGATLARVSYAAHADKDLGVAKGEVASFSANAPEYGWTQEQPVRPKGCKVSKVRN
ncbi:CU044_5270 family protein [Nonomuraea sp. NPDC046802]|uniref:CU044_5270 family protein n=1 Tax=Nonomuraea sp. NPDC046802 TaxID=3154919 RepID=UPI0033D2E220